MMDHVNISRVLDAGTIGLSIDDFQFSTDGKLPEQSAIENQESKIKNVGRPYFVMELIHGIPITKYCDDNHLTPRQRLELFVPVCQAIQHAHQKGIIHRDIKPSNVMVTLYDGKPVPNVIDFGVAKATEQKLTERTMFTQYGTLVGTLEYMSPEQAEMSALGVDTRSDIYSLGVLLYELLTGSTPLSQKRIKEVAFAEILRLIKEEEPPRPSTRLSETGGALASISAMRQTEPARLSQLMRGELDWIVMKTLEKDRARRYQSPNDLADDIQRHLHDEPVKACPPSRLYQFRKLARRRRGAVLAIIIVLFTAVVGGTVAVWQAVRARSAEERALQLLAAEQSARRDSDAARQEVESLSRFLIEAFESPDPQRDGRDITVAEMLDRAVAKIEVDFHDRPTLKAQLKLTLASTYRKLGLPRIGLPLAANADAHFHAEFGPQHLLTLKSTLELLKLYHELEIAQAGSASAKRVLAGFEEQLGENHPDTLDAMDCLIESYRLNGRLNDGLDLRQRHATLCRRTFGPHDIQTISSELGLAFWYKAAGRREEASALNAELLDRSRKVLGPSHPVTIRAINNFATTLPSAELERRAALFEEAMQLGQKVFGNTHSNTLTYIHNLAAEYSDLGRPDDAIQLQEQVLESLLETFPEDHSHVLRSLLNLGVYYNATGRHADAITTGLRSLALEEQRHPRRLYHQQALGNLASSYLQAERYTEASELYDKLLSWEWELDDNEQAHWQIVRHYALAGLGECLVMMKEYDRARSILEEYLAGSATESPGDWWRYHATCLMGAALLGLGQLENAEPLLLTGIDGLEKSQSQVRDTRARGAMKFAREQIVEFYNRKGEPEKADAWREDPAMESQ